MPKFLLENLSLLKASARLSAYITVLRELFRWDLFLFHTVYQCSNQSQSKDQLLGPLHEHEHAYINYANIHAIAADRGTTPDLRELFLALGKAPLSFGGWAERQTVFKKA